MTVRLLFSLLAICSLALASNCDAQVIQLPVMHNFSYTGGALVPDAGTGYLGGYSHSSSGGVARGNGLMGNRAVGGLSGGSHVSASVQVIDLAALDQAILNSAVPAAEIAKTSRTVPVSDAAAADQARKFLGSYPKLETARIGDPSYRDLKATMGNSTPAPRTDASIAESNIRYYLKKGQEAEQANRIQSARVYYKLALESMTPEIMERYQVVLQERAQAEEKAAKEKADGRRQF